ncbi:MAG: hypothetical protein Q7J35_00985 [Candidatus Methanoperedens sp.]|nr:hypothetical protein [Candidatus Methanoperedens sp.]
MVLKQEKTSNSFVNKESFFLLILLSIILMSSVASAAQVLQVSSSRYSLFSPWAGKASDTSLSANFTGYALLLGDNGMPVSGVNITFEIWSPAVKKATRYNITAQNGLASVSYDTYPDFTSSTDADYGNWTIKAYVTGSPTVKDSTNMSMKAGGSGLSGGGCGETYCHKTGTSSGRFPLSPYTAGYGSTSSRAVAAHTKNNHIDEGCYACHPGYAANILIISIRKPHSQHITAQTIA